MIHPTDIQIRAAADALWSVFNYSLPSDPQHIAQVALIAALNPMEHDKKEPNKP